jgi:hypothetical protein
MEFEARSSIIRKEAARILQGVEGGVMNKILNSSWSSTDSVDGSQCSAQSLHASWPQSASDFLASESLQSRDIRNRLSWDIHTIDEIQEESSDSSMTIQAGDSPFVSQPTRLVAGAMPMMDRWDMSLNTPLGGGPVHFEPNGGRISSSRRRLSFPADRLSAPSPTTPTAAAASTHATATPTPTTTTWCEGERQLEPYLKSGKTVAEPNLVDPRSLDASPERWTTGGSPMFHWYLP